MDTLMDGWMETHEKGITGWRGLARPSRRTCNTTSCASLGLWVLTTSRGIGTGRREEKRGLHNEGVEMRISRSPFN